MANHVSQLLVRLIDGVSGPARKAAGALAGIGQAANRVGGLAGRLNAAVERNAAAMDKARGRMVDAMAAGYALQRALSAPLAASAKFEDVLESIRQKTGGSQEAMARLGDQVRAVARQTNQSASVMAGAFDALVGLGANEADAAAMLKPIGKVATAYKANIEEVARASYAALDNLKVPADQLARALDSMAQAGKAGAFELKDMAQYFPSLGAAYAGLNQKGVPAVADLAAALQIARKGAGDSAEAATNLSNVLQKINAPQTRKAFAKMGINLERELAAAAKNGLTPIEAIAEITNKALKGNLGKLGDLFQDAQVQKGLRPLIQNLDEYRRIRAEALNAQGVVEQDFAERLKTASAVMDRFSNTLEDLNLTIGKTILPAMRRIADMATELSAAISSFASQYPNLTRNVIMATAALVGFRVAMAGLRFAGLFVKGGALSLLAATFGRIATAGSKMGAAVKATWALQAALAGGAKYGGLAKAADAMKAVARIVPGLRLVGPALAAIGGALGTITAPVAAGIAAVAAAGFLIYKYWDAASSYVAGFASVIGEALAPALETARPLLEWLAPIGEVIAKGWQAATSALSAFGDWIASFFSREVLSDAQKREWRNAGAEAATEMIEAIKAVFTGLVDWAASIGSQIADALLGKVKGVLGQIKSIASSIGSYVGLGGGDDAPAVDGKRASGGPVSAGRSYLVGEKGPEIITPSRSGYVHPNGSGPGGTYNIGVNVGVKIERDLSSAIDEIERQFSEKLRASLRGLQADYGFGAT
ncbi:phage tail tape measure protein [Ciceribacter azotifigens]|uniref:phage tail tape measure protein n=1 Tax=Ciceribacter azotifigens TaxID=2069303 RepID=UPI003A8A5760